MSGWDGTIRLRENATGEERDVPATSDPALLDDRFGLAWHWTGGNNGCDCNRELEFRRAGGEDLLWDEVECGDSRYSVVAPDWLVEYEKIERGEP